MGEPDMPETAAPHRPVLLAEVLTALAPLARAQILDATFGAGGYSRALLAAGADVLAIDRDPEVAPIAAALTAKEPGRFRFVRGRFSELDRLAERAAIDGVVMDIGVSSMQLDWPERGFSFLREGPLDMRMSGEGVSAAELVNALPEAALADLLFAYGEERKSRRIAKAIVASRDRKPIETTTELAGIIEAAIGRKPGTVHPATRSFQALRIAVNAELDELVAALFASERLLGEGGRLAVVSFHSLEDRIVKRFLDPAKAGPVASRHQPEVAPAPRPWAMIRKPLRPGAAEIADNPRARSAVLRSAVRSASPARPADPTGLGLPRIGTTR